MDGPVPIPTLPSTLTCVADKTSVVVIEGSIIFGLVLHLFKNSGLPPLLTLNTISLSGSSDDSNTISDAFNLLGKLAASLNSISPSLSVPILVPPKSIVLPSRKISLNLKAELPILKEVVSDGNISPETLILFALKPPLADKLPVTLKPDNSKPISKVVADKRLVASIVSATIVLLDESVPVKLPPESGKYKPLTGGISIPK